MLERDAEIVVPSDCPTFLLQLKDVVFTRATASVPVREQKDEFTPIRRLKMRTVYEHGEMAGVSVNDEMGKRIATVPVRVSDSILLELPSYHLTTIARPGGYTYTLLAEPLKWHTPQLTQRSKSLLTNFPILHDELLNTVVSPSNHQCKRNNRLRESGAYTSIIDS